MHKLFLLFANLILVETVLIGLVPSNASKYGFEWIDGSLVEDGYMNWMDDKPSFNDNQQCVVIVYNGAKWRDEACGRAKNYASQRPLGKSL